MATDGKQAAIECPICYESYTSRLKVLSCGHVLCEGCMNTIEGSREHKGKCPSCKTLYKKDVYTLFPDLVIQGSTSTRDLLQRTKQHVLHVINPLGVMSSAEEIRDAYNEAREHRAQVRNAATGSSNLELEELTVAVTQAVDALEDKLHYSLQKQDLARSIQEMKKKLKGEKADHELERAALKADVALLKQKNWHEERERSKSTTALESYKERLHTAVLETKQQTKRAEDQQAQLNDLHAELAMTKNERANFQAQLEDYRKKALKQRAVISQLKQELEELKSKERSKSPGARHNASYEFPLVDWPFIPRQTPELIDLCSSSPGPQPALLPQQDISRKRPRTADENLYLQTGDVPLLPPPKVRVGGTSRPRSELVEKAVTRTNGQIRRWVAEIPRGATPSAKPIPPNQAKGQLALGQGGKLVAMKTRKVRAV